MTDAGQSADGDRVSDAFDALRADTTPIQPSASFRRELRAGLVTELEQLVSNVTSTPATPDLSVVNTVTPYLCVDGAAAAIDFYVQAFGAVEHHRMVGDDGRIGHAEIVIGTSRIMLADEYPEVGVLSPTTRGGTSTNFTLAVADAAALDAAFRRAIALGATELRPVEDQFYGQRQGTLRDPFGHQWSLSSPIAGFGDDQYDANSIDAGFEVQRPASSASDASTEASSAAIAPVDDVVDPQFKHHVLGDLYYFTLPTPDLERAQRFFGAVLGWQVPDPADGHVGNISAPPGGVVPGDQVTRLYFVVDDIDAAADRVRAAGGSAQTPVHYASGWSVECIDDQGTAFSLSVPSPDHGGLHDPAPPRS